MLELGQNDHDLNSIDMMALVGVTLTIFSLKWDLWQIILSCNSVTGYKAVTIYFIDPLWIIELV